MSDERIWTAAVLVIGDEILSGRTQDRNVAQIATWLDVQGIRLREVRIVPDVEAEIVDALNALRARTDYVFTTGGIGPTHDDITVDAVAKALGVEVVIDRKSVVEGKSVSVRVDLGGRRIIKKKHKKRSCRDTRHNKKD